MEDYLDNGEIIENNEILDEDIQFLEQIKEEDKNLSENESFYLKNYPISIITGDFGAGKTLLATFMAITYKINAKLNIFANYDIHLDEGFRKVTFDEVAQMPEWLHNGVLVLDEMQIGADSYNSMSPQVKKMTTFITQIRKRDIIVILTTQRFRMVARRIRLLINYYIEVESVSKGIVSAKTFNVAGGWEELLHERTYNLRDFYPFYDTREVIRNKIKDEDVDDE